MQRKKLEHLLAWKNKPLGRLPLILNGARQVGKTFLVNEFGRASYQEIVYLNFEQTPSLASLFEGDLLPQRLIMHLEIYTGKRITPGEVLIFMDEIQACDRALTSLKYFAELAPEYHVIAAGSLLGVAVGTKTKSFPVGKVEQITLQALDFEEFLWAIDEERLAQEIRHSFVADQALPGIIHEKALELYRQYLCIGGMPAAVNEYRQNRSLLGVREVHDNILNAYIADMAKYAAPAETVRIRTAFNSIPTQLAKDNRKFQYKLLAKGARSSHFGPAIDWLAASGIVSLCWRIEQGKMPLKAQIDLSAFKMYMADTGMLLTKADVSLSSILENTTDAADGFRGATTENYVAQCLQANGYKLYYWESEGIAEVDFLIQRDGQVIPVEVKTATHNRSRSLNEYVKKYDPPYAIRVSGKNFGFENGIKSVPLYALFAL